MLWENGAGAMQGSRTAATCVALLGAVLAVASVHAAQPAAVTPVPPDWPHRAPWKLNRELLLPETDRIVFVVDTERGSPPVAEALDQLVSLASKYGGRPASWVRLGDPGAPAVRWIEPPVPPKPVNYYVRLRDGQTLSDFQIPRDDVETIRYLVEIPACPSGPLPTNVSYVFVRYLGNLGSAFGNAGKVVSDASCGGREFRVVRVAQTRIAEARPPGIGQDSLERRALAHEYGHVLGLASNPEHGRWSRTVPYRGGQHCIHRDCAVSIATAMALLKGQLVDYCAACLRDIAQAREHWLTGKEFPETPRLPQPDPAGAVARLKKHNFREGGEADKLVGYGKAVMPYLVARLAELPGGSVASPRSYAIRLALRIVIAEDDERRLPGTPACDVDDSTAHTGAEFLSWWHQESERFMAGDDWLLPAMLRVPISN
jgi:hypothetical protein